MGNLKGIIVVTGASSGIGFATAELCAQNGYKVYAGVRKEADYNKLKEIVNITPFYLDVTNIDQIQNLKKTLDKDPHPLVALVNNAGIAKAGPLMDVPVDALRDQFEVNFFGIHQLTQTMFPKILADKGRIVMISSDSGFFATPFFGPYCASKFALEGYSDSLRRELLLYEIPVILIEPGRVSTPIWSKGEELLTQFSGSIFEKEAIGVGEYAIRKGKTAGLDPMEVAKTILKAIHTKKPKNRYLIAPNIKKYRMIQIMPSKVVDNMVRKELAVFKQEENTP